MKIIYLNCGMGAAGDMLTAALLEICPDPKAFWYAMESLDLPGVQISAAPAQQCGVRGTRMHVLVHGEEETQDAPPAHDHDHDHAHHPHRHLADMEALFRKQPLDEAVIEDACAVYRDIAQAEGEVHGRPPGEVHFHEVGALDAAADVLACCLLFSLIGADEVAASPINTGSGHVRCAHGVLPVPAPATARLLEGIPTYSDGTRGELCTPTGAALLRHFVTHFCHQPLMAVERIGYGIGTKEFPKANCVRAFLGEGGMTGGDIVAQLSCNLDDMTPEAVAFAVEKLLDAGALDAFTTPIGMKKARPGIELTCLCPAERKEEFARLILRHTRTLGVRMHMCERRVLPRSSCTVHTAYGDVRMKVADGPGGRRAKPEYDDVRRLARKCDATFEEVTNAARHAHHHTEK